MYFTVKMKITVYFAAVVPNMFLFDLVEFIIRLKTAKINDSKNYERR